jgi:hypothetical protein
LAEDAPDIGSALLRDLFTYWDNRRRDQPFPKRSDIDPVDIPRLLPHIFLITVERGEELRFRVRLAGTHVEAAFQQFTTGRYLEQIKLDGETDDILARYNQCAETGLPVLSRHVFVNEDRRSFDYQRLLLPLAVDHDTRVDMILGGVCFAAPLTTPPVLRGSTRPGMDRRPYV